MMPRSKAAMFWPAVVQGGSSLVGDHTADGLDLREASGKEKHEFLLMTGAAPRAHHPGRSWPFQHVGIN